MGLGVGRGLVGLFKQWGKSIGNAADHVWLGEEGQKAIRDEVTQKFKPKIDLANTAESRRATNIKDLDAKLNQSKKDLTDAQTKWQDKYNSELAAAQNKRQTDIADYNAKSQAYQKALDDANANRDSILAQLRDNEIIYDPSRTLFTDVSTGDKYIYDQFTGQYKNLTKIYPTLNKKQQRDVRNSVKGFDNRLLDSNKSFKLVNAFDDSDINTYASKSKWFKEYSDRIKAQDTNLRNAENEINRANSDLTKWTTNNPNSPKNWTKNDSNRFGQDFRKNNVEPTEYSFNGQKYSDVQGLEAAYRKALNHAQNKRDYFRTKASNYASERDKEIAQRIQDAKDINKAKVALGLGTAGALAGATYAAFSGDDNTDNTNNTDYGKPDPNFNIKNTPEVQAQLNDEQQSDTAPIDTGFDPDKADALAAMAFRAASESDDTHPETHPETPELAELSADDIHTNEGIGTRRSMNEGLFSVIKALQDPHQANAVADYIYSRYGNDPELQQLGWRAWLNKYYGDALRSQMNLDASGYNGMHIA